MAEKTERVKMLEENLYNEFVNHGKSLSEIEEKYGVSRGYSYKLLDKIAAKNGVSKETFYQRQHGFHVVTDTEGRIIPTKAVSFKEIQEELDKAEEILGKISKSLLSLKNEMSRTLEEMEKERL